MVLHLVWGRREEGDGNEMILDGKGEIVIRQPSLLISVP